MVPSQGDWDVASYLALATNRPIEFTRGFLEFLPMPDEVHEEVAFWIKSVVVAILKRRGNGVCRLAPFKTRIAKDKVREPDLCVLLDRADPRRGRKYWSGADIVVEIVSPDGTHRDYVEKRRDYARAGIPEYWIVDPRRRSVRQLSLEGKRYRVVGTFRPGEVPASLMLEGWTFDVAACVALIDQASAHDEPPAARD